MRLLFDGPLYGRELRRRMDAAGVKTSRAAFSRLMRRMELAGFLKGRTVREKPGDRTILLVRYQVTDMGVAAWRTTREFFAAGDGPPPELKPIATEEGQLLHLPPEARRALIERREQAKIRMIIRRILHGRPGESR